MRHTCEVLTLHQQGNARKALPELSTHRTHISSRLISWVISSEADNSIVIPSRAIKRNGSARLSLMCVDTTSHNELNDIQTITHGVFPKLTVRGCRSPTSIWVRKWDLDTSKAAHRRCYLLYNRLDDLSWFSGCNDNRTMCGAVVRPVAQLGCTYLQYGAVIKSAGMLYNRLQRVWALSIRWTIFSAISAFKQDYELAMDPKNKVFWEEFIEIYRQNSCFWEVKSKEY
jgi:hypothetical protein